MCRAAWCLAVSALRTISISSSSGGIFCPLACCHGRTAASLLLQLQTGAAYSDECGSRQQHAAAPRPTTAHTMPAMKIDDDYGSITCSSFQRPPNPTPDLSLSTSNSSFDHWNLFAPFVTQIGSKWHLYYSGGPDTKPAYLAYQIGLATATDPDGPWTKHGAPLLPLGVVDNFHATPTLLRGMNNTVLKEDGMYSMLYCGNRNDMIYRATSRDGIVWVKNATAIFQGYAPNALRGPDGQLWLYSILKPVGKLWEVSLAKGRDWDSLLTVKTVLVSNTQPWEDGNMFYPYAFFDQSGWTLAWSAYSNHTATHGGIPCKKSPKNPDQCLQTTAIGIAHSQDGMAFTKCEGNPVLWPQVADSYDSTYVGCPCLVTANVTTPLLYYAGRVDQTHKYYSIGHARLGPPIRSSDEAP